MKENTDSKALAKKTAIERSIQRMIKNGTIKLYGIDPSQEVKVEWKKAKKTR